ncbi:MAG TPA: nucleotidyltransferase domain-containing protein [Pirellulaceae bacterium]|nr:nucleotidyltransferase domain-containing protein [Pirellulaceae bacterium]
MNEKLQKQIAQHPYPLVFATISGAHLYGFPSPDSDFDLRGVHLLPLREVVGLDAGDETVEKSCIDDGLEIDLVTHDAKKFFGLLLKKNGYVLEQIFSPLIVRTTPEHAELKAIARDCITKFHAYHYLGFAETQWKLFHKESPPRVKPLLYVYRVLLTGIHLMRTGEVEANLLTLNATAQLPFITELVARKLAGPEKSQLPQADLAFHEQQVQRLIGELETASTNSRLPEAPSGKERLNDLLVRLRLQGRA